MTSQMVVAEDVLTGAKRAVGRKGLKAQELKHNQSTRSARGATVKGKVLNPKPVALWVNLNIHNVHEVGGC